MRWRIVGTFTSGGCVQHALADAPRDGRDQRLACGVGYDEGRYFFVASAGSAAEALAAGGSSELSCPGCQRALQGAA